MDILIAVPKKLVDHFWRDYLDEGEEFWKVHPKPVHVNPGDWLWFKIGNEIVAKAPLLRLQSGRMDCVSGKSWDGHFVVWDLQKFEKLDKPIRCEKALRNYTYDFSVE